MENSSIPTHLTSVTALDYASYDTSSLSSAPWILVNIDTKGLVDIVTKRFPQTLEETFESIFQGVVTGVDDIYFLDKTAEQNDDIIELFSPREARSVLIESAILKPMLKGEDLFRYGQPDYNCYCIYPYKVDGNRTVILEEDELSTTYPYAYEYLKRHQTELRRLRVKFKTNPHYWYSCHRSRSMRAFERDRIITPEISLGCNMTLSPAGVYHNTKVYSLLPKDSTQESIFYWLGVLNSQLMWWFISNTGYVLRGGYYAFKTNYLKPFPLRTIDFAEIKDVAKHDQVATYAKEMLSLHSTATKNSSGNSSLQRQIVELDHELNTLVYDLYELSKQEREIIQKS